MQQAHIFFIGGAGDVAPYYLWGPMHTMARLARISQHEFILKRPQFRHHVLHVLGFHQIYRKADVEAICQTLQPDNLIYIIGHSLGGWNAVHFSRQLVEAGLRVEMLVTLDPVGEGKMVQLGSEIYDHAETEPRAQYWINIRAKARCRNKYDVIADLGTQWNVPQALPDIDETLDLNHDNALGMLTQKPAHGKSVLDLLINSLEQFI